MALPDPVPGLVISYAYLWREEAQQGRQEGLKNRPCVVVLAVEQIADRKVVTVAPFTHTTPRNQDGAIELPQATKQRLGLDDQRSWIVTTELNRFVWPGPDLRPISRGRPNEFVHGALPKALTQQVINQLIKNNRIRPLGVVDRND